MREIKFRAWIKYPNNDIKAKSVMQFDAQKWASFGDICQDDSDEVVLMQYTGLKDRLGKEIWEGDIIKHYMGDSLQTNPSVVKWNSDGGWSPWLEFEGDSYTRVSKAEVIGNIYSNPELLKEY